MEDIFDKKNLSERDICTKYITPAIVETAGWNRDTQLKEELSLTKGKVFVRGKLHHRALAPLNGAASLTPEESERAVPNLAEHFDTLYDSVETLRRLRSTILQLAVQGKLNTRHTQDVSAAVLLAEIEHESEADQEKQLRKKTNLLPINLSDRPFVLPAGWQWARLGRLVKILEYGTSEKASYDSNGVPIFRMNNIAGGEILHSNLKYVSPLIKDLPRLYLRTNDLLFNRTNSYELVGKTGIFKGENNRFTFASYLIRIRLSSLLSPEYVNLAMNADYFRSTQINSEVTQQCGQANFNGTKLANTLIPLPPLAEQKRIVTTVTYLMSLCDQLEVRLRQVESDREKLMNAAVHHVLQTVSSAA